MWGNIVELAFCFLPLNLTTCRGGAGPEAHSRRPPSTLVLHVSPPLGMAGAVGLPTARTVCGPRTLLLPVRPRNLQTHVQKSFHRSDVKAQTFQPCGPVLRLVDHGIGPNHDPLQKYQRQTDWQTIC